MTATQESTTVAHGGTKPAYKYIGTDRKRVEDPRLLVGRGGYIADMKIQGLLHAAILRSPHGSADIVHLEPRILAQSRHLVPWNDVGVDEIDFAAFESDHAAVLVTNEADHQPVSVGLRRIPVIRVAQEADMASAHIFLKREGARADRLADHGRRFDER